MLENRNLTHDLFAIALLALTVFLGAALATYNPADPVGPLPAPLSMVYQPDTLVYPAAERAVNACGPWGALAADLMFSGFGLGAYYLVASLAAVDFLLLRRQDIGAPTLRLFGWTASLFGMATLAGLLLAGVSPGPVIGGGGYLGAIGRALLETQFATAGAVILALGVTVAGLFLATDYAMIRMAHYCGRIAVLVGLSASKQVKARGWKLIGSRRVRDPNEPAVRMGGKRGSDDLAAPAFSHPIASPPHVTLPAKKAAVVPVAEVLPAEPELQEEFEDEIDEPLVVMKAKPSKKQKATAAQEITGGPHFKIKKKQQSAFEQVLDNMDDADKVNTAANYQLPSLNLLEESEDVDFATQEIEVLAKAKILEKTFAEFGFSVKVVEIETGPVIAQYEVSLEAGLRLSKITGLADDLAIALRVPSVRIVAPIPGKNTVGIEVPNETRVAVRLREVMEESSNQLQKMRIPLFLGKDVSGNSLVADLSTLPHLLIAGRTGTGKSVCLNAIITSILMTRRPDEVRMLMIDPKMVELSGYGRLPHLMHPVVTDMKKAEAILAWAVDKMEERYSLLAKAGVRHIAGYNQLGDEELMDRLQPEDEEQKKNIPTHLPYIVIVADEMADLMMQCGKEVEQHIIRLAQKSRAVGIHLILATQKPTVDVITGLIKSNLPARLSFQVASRTDSRVVLDENGADKLLGNGDMLFLGPGTSTLLRGQGTYLSDEEINKVTAFVSTGEQNFVKELVNLKVEEGDEVEPGALKNRDDLYEAAVDIVVREGRGSVSLLQRNLAIGYGRAARLIDFMAEDRIVGEYNGSQAREVIISIADWERMQGMEPSGDDPASSADEELENEDHEDDDDFGADEAPSRRRNSKAVS
ncbi:DNA translocase FtsK [Lignipirellula cremea]|uniref:DNA translocase FtsK n=1 Tax=Lignipirellula cremea TaxID=2528010 RepID=A0A518E082_9BACT|nr:DNA translocase FtsK [Lignipirellula cremea]QDU97506.1 DNA translocase FtsK [Lignipirellula cremea]